MKNLIIKLIGKKVLQLVTLNFQRTKQKSVSSFLTELKNFYTEIDFLMNFFLQNVQMQIQQVENNFNESNVMSGK